MLTAARPGVVSYRAAEVTLRSYPTATAEATIRASSWGFRGFPGLKTLTRNQRERTEANDDREAYEHIGQDTGEAGLPA
jgi:hypothetical protein